MLRSIAQDSKGFEEVYAQEFQGVFRAVLLVCGVPAVAEDSAQEAFARALERWPRLSGGLHLRGWLVQTAVNVARRSLRKRVPLGALLAGSRDSEAAVDLWNAVRTLPRREQEALVLHYMADLPIAEISALMHCAEGTVKVHLSRARNKLRVRLSLPPDQQED